VLRFSALEWAIPTISQKILIQQLRQLEADDIVRRIARPDANPRASGAARPHSGRGRGSARQSDRTRGRRKA
jgi:hypothetical protein